MAPVAAVPTGRGGGTVVSVEVSIARLHGVTILGVQGNAEWRSQFGRGKPASGGWDSGLRVTLSIVHRATYGGGSPELRCGLIRGRTRIVFSPLTTETSSIPRPGGISTA